MNTPDNDYNLNEDQNETPAPENPQDSIENRDNAIIAEPDTVSGGEADTEGIDRATEAAEASFTLEAEKGVSPVDPDENNPANKDDYNIKQ